MKKVLLLFSFAIVFVLTKAQQNNFVIKGTQVGKADGKLYLSYIGDDGTAKIDSTQVVNGQFEFVGTLKDAREAYLRSVSKGMALDNPRLTSFFIEPGQLTLTLPADDFKKYKLSGSKTENEYQELTRLKASIRAEMQPINDAYNIANNKLIDAKRTKQPQKNIDSLLVIASSIREKFEPFNEQLNQIDHHFVQNHPDSYLSASLMLYKVPSLSLNSAQQIYGKWSKRVQQSSFGQRVKASIENLKKGSPGAVATVFSGTDIDSKPLSLTDFKGKYVLLDFWASWCVPCRKGNPHLKTLYAKYKDQGLEIIGIADDDSNPEAWRNAVKQDEIAIWKHILRGLKRTKDGFDRSADISEHYGIHLLPTKILIDPEGKIIGRYGGGGESDEAMDQKLAEVMKSNRNGK